MMAQIKSGLVAYKVNALTQVLYPWLRFKSFFFFFGLAFWGHTWPRLRGYS